MDSQEIKDFIISKGGVILDIYKVKQYTKVAFIDIEKYKYDCRADHLLLNHESRRVSNTNPYSVENINNWINIHNKPFTLMDTEYNSKSLKFYCKKCFDYFYSNWNKILAGKGCGVCTGKQVGENHSFEKTCPELVAEWSFKNKTLPSAVTRFSEKIVLWKCEKCNNEWFSKIEHRTIYNTGCPRCSLSKGEMIIDSFLQENSISYERQYKFKKCINKKQLPFDFFIPDENLCIEYNGKQHYEKVDFFGGEDGFNYTRNNDQLKKQYCDDNNIRLLIIPFWEKENISDIIQRELLCL
jgi:hypothetical protein